jgi:lysophospholipase L1-like esterase
MSLLRHSASIHKGLSSNQLLSRNADIVEAGGYNTIVEAGGNIGGFGAGVYVDILIHTHDNRIRQNGNIEKVKFYFAATSSEAAKMDGFIFKVWRKDGSTYDLVGSEDILSKLVAETTTLVTLDTPIAVQEGDFIGLGMDASAGQSPLNFLYAAGSSPDRINYVTSEASSTDFDWDSQSVLFLNIASKIYMQAPLIVGIGNSIMQGLTGHNSFIDNTNNTDITNQIMYQLGQLDNRLNFYQNMGAGGNNTTQILARFQTDMIDLKPRYALIEGGINDLDQSVSQATYISNYTDMFDLCVANNVIPIVCKIMPWTSGTNTEMQTRDTWSTALETLIDSSYPTATFIDFDVTLGKFRVGGDPGNLWDIKSEYFVDGVHYNKAGYTATAAKVYDSL